MTTRDLFEETYAALSANKARSGLTILGIVIGILPGLGGIVGLSMLLPFLYGMDPASALAMLIGLAAVIATSDTFTAVMMGIPGSSAAQAPTLDGFPLAKQGQAARALSAAFSASMVGGLFGAAILTVAVLVARPVILLFGSPEMLSICVFGLTLVASLSGNAPLKGLTGTTIGLLLSMIGYAQFGGIPRYWFGLNYLLDGLPLGEVSTSMTINATAPILLALYVAVAQVLAYVYQLKQAAAHGETPPPAPSPLSPASWGKAASRSCWNGWQRGWMTARSSSRSKTSGS